MADLLRKKVVLDWSANASEDLSPYHFVVLSSGEAAVAGDGVVPLGVVTRQFGTDEEATIVTHGIVPIKIGTAGSLAVGDAVAVDANGQADAGTTGDAVAAILITAPSADGDVVMAYVDYGHANVATI